MSIAKGSPRAPLACLTGLLAATAILLSFAAAASAANFQRPFEEKVGPFAEVTLGAPTLLAVDPSNGDIVVGDQGNDSQQEVTVSATSGAFKLSLEGETTADLPYDASSDVVEEALNLAVTGSANGTEIEVRERGSAAGSSSYEILFHNSYAGRPIEQISCENGSTPLSGGSGCTVKIVSHGAALGLYRYAPDGAPATFTALGEDVIDGKRGPGGKPCAQEPASCDETPQNGIEMTRNSNVNQIAVGPNGNIYLTEGGWFEQPHDLVYVFSPEGRYLGELNSSKIGVMKDPCGVAVDSAGAIYVAGKFGETGAVAKYVPQSNVPVNADNTEVFTLDVQQRGDFKVQGAYCQLAIGAGPTADSIFLGGLNQNDGVVVMNKENGEQHQFAEGSTGERGQGAKGYGGVVTVDPTSGNPILVRDSQGAGEAAEFDGSEETAGAPLSRLVEEQDGLSGIGNLVANAAGDVYVITGAYDPHIFVYGEPAVVPAVTAEPATEVTGTKATLSGEVNPEGTKVDDCFFEYGTTTSYGSTADCGVLMPEDSEAHPVQIHLSGLLPNGTTYHFRLAAGGENGTERGPDMTFRTAYQAVTDPVQATGTETATLRGTVRPEGKPFISCSFE